MKLKITQQNIDRAVAGINQRPRPKPSQDCIVAQALRREFPGKQITVAYTSAFIDGTYYNLDGAETYTRLDMEEWHAAKPGEIEINKII